MNNIPKWPDYSDNPVVRIEVCHTVKEISDIRDIIENLKGYYNEKVEEDIKEEYLKEYNQYKRIADALFEVGELLDIIKQQVEKQKD